MPSNFYIVNHKFNTDMAKVRDNAYAEMAPGGGHNYSVVDNKAKVFYNHLAN